MNGIASDRRTKILCTIGPSSSDPSVLMEMMKEGMNAARLNFSHGEHSVHLETIQKIRQVQKDLGGIPFAIVQDLQGPKIRIGKLGKSFMIVEGEEIVITIDKSVIASGEDDEPRPRKVSTSYPNLVRDCRPGSRLMIDDGYLEVHVVSKNQEETEMVCKVVTGGMLSQRKGINMVDEGATISAPALTEKDINDLEFGMKSGEINYVCLSFVRTAQDIIDAKNLMIKFAGKTIPIIAKIERIEAIRNIDDILKEADGLMVARGDLMIETNFHELPIFQKELIEKSSKAGKIDITATQMLQSMVESKIPTRAEVTDVSNACFDGTDVVMLSNESAMGKYPVLSVKTMHLIVRTADINYRKFARLDSHDNDFNSYASDSIENASCMAAASIANKHSGVKLICCITNSGKTAVNISQYRPSVPIIALTDQDFTFNRLTLGWGITPVLISNTDAISGPHNVEEVCCKYLVEKSFAKQGDLVVLVIGAETVNHMAHTVRLLKLP